eukprot:15926137-Heterocapsa_arctica.AAC.1
MCSFRPGGRAQEGPKQIKKPPRLRYPPRPEDNKISPMYLDKAPMYLVVVVAAAAAAAAVVVVVEDEEE